MEKCPQCGLENVKYEVKDTYNDPSKAIGYMLCLDCGYEWDHAAVTGKN